MGLFSKKELICKKCGKVYISRIDLYDGLCGDCYLREEEQSRKLQAEVAGYSLYQKVFKHKTYTTDEMHQIIAHRSAILEKYSKEGVIAVTMNGASVALGRFFCPNGFDGTIVDADDVFAIAISAYNNTYSAFEEMFQTTLFTNDPYIPAFSLLWVARKKLFELKGKKDRETVKELLSDKCRNLTYPVADIGVLEKIIKKDKTVHGAIDIETMIKICDDALLNQGVFKDTYVNALEIPPQTASLYEKNGIKIYTAADMVNNCSAN